MPYLSRMGREDGLMGAQQEEGGSGRSRPNGAAAVGAGRAGRSAD